MKKTSGLIILTMVILFGFQVNTAHGETPQMEKRPVTHQVKLTTEQQKQIEVLEQQILSKRKEVIEKYVQYGVLTKEQGTHITKRMDEHYNHLKNNGFVPLLKKPQHHHHKFKKTGSKGPVFIVYVLKSQRLTILRDKNGLICMILLNVRC